MSSGPDKLYSVIPQGLTIREKGPVDPDQFCEALLKPLGLTDLQSLVICKSHHGAGGDYFNLHLSAEQAEIWAPSLDTLNLATALESDPLNTADLQREIVVALLLSPITTDFPGVEEFFSAVRIRINTVQAARKTSLAFHTSEAERPTDCWRYDEDEGFVIRPETSLITALIKATQPEVSGCLYSFSCYRASEYVMLLGMAQEMERANPALYQQLQTMWSRHPIKSGKFHDTFLHEQGSMETPLPPHYFVPGDRTWFRNPDEASADASGFEGSWVIYLGGGQFSNFWKCSQPYSLTEKCLEIYHWRHGLYLDDEGEERINEVKVADLVQESRKQPAEVSRIVAMMERYREARGVYTDAGGCIDTTREFARWVGPEYSDIVLPVP